MRRDCECFTCAGTSGWGDAWVGVWLGRHGSGRVGACGRAFATRPHSSVVAASVEADCAKGLHLSYVGGRIGFGGNRSPPAASLEQGQAACACWKTSLLQTCSNCRDRACSRRALLPQEEALLQKPRPVEHRGGLSHRRCSCVAGRSCDLREHLCRPLSGYGPHSHFTPISRLVLGCTGH
mgnify:CR=1 FL=1